MARGQLPSSYPLMCRRVLSVWTLREGTKVLRVPHSPLMFQNLAHWAFKGSPAPGTADMGTPYYGDTRLEPVLRLLYLSVETPQFRLGG